MIQAATSQNSSKESGTAHTLKCLEVWGGSDHASHTASVPGMDICVHSRPVEGDTGGDLYLVSSCSSGLITRVLLADVSGHGSDVTGLADELRHAMHKSINTVDQSKIARTLNNAFGKIGGGSRFATALLVTHYAPSGHLLFVNAGHPPPMLNRSGESSWSPIDRDRDDVISETTRDLKVGIRNLPLGVIGDTSYEQFALKIGAGDRIVCYTDAYSEAGDAQSGSMLGVSGLARLLGRTAGDDGEVDLAPGVLEALDGEGHERADDDHTMISMRMTGEGPTRPGLGAITRALASGLGLGHRDTSPAG